MDNHFFVIDNSFENNQLKGYVIDTAPKTQIQATQQRIYLDQWWQIPKLSDSVLIQYDNRIG